MNENKFTPGPWVIDTATRPAEVCTIHGLPESETNGQGYAYVRGDLGYWSADESENMANACLIAAAPELLEAAQAAIAYDAAIEQSANDPAAMSSFCTATGDTLDALYEDWITKARAALAKARDDS